MKNKIVLIPFVLMLLISGSCSKGGKSGSSGGDVINFTAKLGDTYNGYDFSKLKVVAVPVDGFRPLVK